MIRQEIIKRKNKDIVKWRSHEVFRIEAFSDAVFAFSITLLIVSLEVPETFDQLMNTMKGFFAFAISFAVLFQIWYAQFQYFRRYGIENTFTIILNAVLLFLVLFYMYPLKFLFSLLIPGGLHNVHEGETIITADQVPDLMIIYGLGFVAIHFIFILLYRHALTNKNELELNEEEEFETRTRFYAYIILSLIGMSTIIYAYSVVPVKAGYAGYLYFLIGPVMTVYYTIRGKTARKKFGKG